LWTKSVTVGAQSLRPPIDWDIIPTQVPNLDEVQTACLQTRVLD
jgi:hypothetical protein